MIRPAAALLTVLLASAITFPAMAGDDDQLPQFPKVAPPEPLPEASCDTSAANDGGWLLGRWVAPQSRWEFTRANGAIAWTLDRKGTVNRDFGWQEGAQIAGTADKVSACSVHLVAGQGDFQFDGVLTESGKIYGFAVNPKGDTVRFVLRREH